MVNRQQLMAYLNTLLQPQAFKDYCPNGLQVEGSSQIAYLISGVTACQALIDHAAREGADALLVHHGTFWKGEDPCLNGMKQKRCKALLLNDINLIAYHLPLDAHPEFGNNVQLAKQMDWKVCGPLEGGAFNAVGCVGELKAPIQGVELQSQLTQVLAREALYIPGQTDSISRIAWCTGAAQDDLVPAIEQGVDAFITGEVSERTVHLARENGIHFYSAGHHATERYGVQALGQHLAEKFSIKHVFVDIDNPV